MGLIKPDPHNIVMLMQHATSWLSLFRVSPHTCSAVATPHTCQPQSNSQKATRNVCKLLHLQTCKQGGVEHPSGADAHRLGTRTAYAAQTRHLQKSKSKQGFVLACRPPKGVEGTDLKEMSTGGLHLDTLVSTDTLLTHCCSLPKACLSLLL